jgi:hypothetical protein
VPDVRRLVRVDVRVFDDDLPARSTGVAVASPAMKRPMKAARSRAKFR